MARKLMTAVQYSSYGGPDGLQHVEVPVPTPNKDEVLLKIEAVSLNPVDWKVQKGALRPFLPPKFPHIPVADVVGDVIEVGSRIKNFKAGDKVVAMVNPIVLIKEPMGMLSPLLELAWYKLGEEFSIVCLSGKESLRLDMAPLELQASSDPVYNGVNFDRTAEGEQVMISLASTIVVGVVAKNGGGLAEFAVTKGSLTVARPPELSADKFVGLPVAGLTAYHAITQSAGIKLDGSGTKSNILITAASGGVGHYAVQLAKLGNAHVTATCGARNIEFVKGLGADEVIDYKTPDGAALRSPSGKKYDTVIHCAAGIPWSTFEPNLSSNGKVIDITPGLGALLTFALQKLTFSKKLLVPLILIPKDENLRYLVNLVKEGKLKTVIDSKYPMDKVKDAWAKISDGHATGKIIVEN
ncbi:hypothetical protein CJ030_MR1G002448 [Morella rubra]|uniref:Enoyl reductase (ER) domain-containing protein n=1 Tax=Morella rubra TaxID=262757 RepID=A0A6A1WJP7_9ROSI|nr:hypothetical protein CJ030_MR1G002448 [Morella rubra]